MNVHIDPNGVLTDVDKKLVDDVKDALKPGAIADPGTVEGDKKGPDYILAKSEWAAIQTYVNNALLLPTTDDEFRTSINAPADYSVTDFTQLISCYQGINTHVTNWQDNVFPASVSLASRVYQYGTQKVPVYYPAISKVADQVGLDPDNKTLKAKLIAMIQSVQDTAQGFADEAKTVSDQVAQFANDTKADKALLVGPNGDEGLTKYYDDKYGKTSKEVQDLTQQIKDMSKIAQDAMDEYNKDVTIAATTPTYAWIFPVGTIAGAVVAGIYGKRAVDALDTAQAAQAKVDELTEQLQRDANLMIYIHNASIGMDQITLKLAAALPALQKLQGAWQAMSDDLGRIVDIIDKDIKKAPPIIASLGVDEAARAWASVASAADNYRKNAYISVEGDTEAAMNSLQVKHLYLGRLGLAA